MKLQSCVVVLYCAYFAVAAASRVAGASRVNSTTPFSPHMRGSEHAHHGFADADLERDGSLRLIRQMSRQARGEGRPTEPPTEDSQTQSKIQQSIERMATRVENLGDAKSRVVFTRELIGVERALLAENVNTQLASEIQEVRAELCAAQGFGNDKKSQCEAFMQQACGSGGTVAQGPCHQFFGIERSTDAAKSVPDAASSAGAGSPALFGGMEGRPLPEQGFTGSLVMHTDETRTGDWMEEFGPKAGHRSFVEICNDFADNEWCRLHGYYTTERLGARRERARSGCVLNAPITTMTMAALLVGTTLL